jgi:hypothetical protein
MIKTILYSLLALLLSAPLSAQNEEIPEPIEDESLILNIQSSINHCHWPPATYTKIDYKLRLLGEYYQGGAHPFMDNSQTSLKRDCAYLCNKFIHQAADFNKHFGFDTKEVDWETEKIIIVSNSLTYKFSSPDYKSETMGIVQVDSQLVIGVKNVKLGPCQGIHVEYQEYSNLNTYYYAILPKSAPEKIQSVYCYEGPDCSGIP